MTDAESAPAAPPQPPALQPLALQPLALQPWGYLATFGWAALAAVTSVVVTLAALILWHRGGTDPLPDLTADGLVFSSITVATSVLQTAILVLAAYLAGWRVVDYFGLVWPSRREAMIAVAAMVAFILGFDALTYLLGRDIVTPFQLDTYRSAHGSGGLLLLWITFVVVAPAGEEIMFRGFLYRGWAASPRAVLPAIVVISAAWAIIHVQYDWFGILQVFLVGLVLGWVRWRSGSTLLTFALHALANAWATLQTMAKVEWLSSRLS